MHCVMERYELKRGCNCVHEKSSSYNLISLYLKRKDHRIGQKSNLVNSDKCKQNDPAESFVSRHNLNPIRIRCKNWESEQSCNCLIIFRDSIDFTLHKLSEHRSELKSMLSVHDKDVFDICDEQQKQQKIQHSLHLNFLALTIFECVREKREMLFDVHLDSKRTSNFLEVISGLLKAILDPVESTFLLASNFEQKLFLFINEVSDIMLIAEALLDLNVFQTLHYLSKYTIIGLTFVVSVSKGPRVLISFYENSSPNFLFLVRKLRLDYLIFPHHYFFSFKI